MSSSIIASYPIIALSPASEEEDTGITKGEHERK
jgi:hypothetical protein